MIVSVGSDSRSETYLAAVLSVLEVNRPSISMRTLSDRLRSEYPNEPFSRFQPQSLRQGCAELVEAHQLVRLKLSNFVSYRLPFDYAAGDLLIVRNVKDRLGWVEGHFRDQHNRSAPLVRWIGAPVAVPIAESAVDLVSDPLQYQKARVAYQFASGRLPDEFIDEIPPQLLQCLLVRVGERYHINEVQLFRIALHLGFADKSNLESQWRSQTLNYLDLLYPSWQETWLKTGRLTTHWLG